MIHLHDEGTDFGSQGRTDRARRASLAKRATPGREVATQNGQKLRHTATSDVDYSAADLALFKEVDRYKRATGRQFLTILEVVECAERVGWHKPTQTWSLEAKEDIGLSMAS